MFNLLHGIFLNGKHLQQWHLSALCKIPLFYLCCFNIVVTLPRPEDLIRWEWNRTLRTFTLKLRIFSSSLDIHASITYGRLDVLNLTLMPEEKLKEETLLENLTCSMNRIIVNRKTPCGQQMQCSLFSQDGILVVKLVLCTSHKTCGYNCIKNEMKNCNAESTYSFFILTLIFPLARIAWAAAQGGPEIHHGQRKICDCSVGSTLRRNEVRSEMYSRHLMLGRPLGAFSWM